ncbi:MAG: WcaI family glycosyltransferase [Chitinophagaceae bacterium]
MNKRVLLIAGNFFPEPTGIGKYNGEMIDLLASQGYECTVVTSYPYYPYWKVQEPYSINYSRYTKEIRYPELTGSSPVEIFRCPIYVPHNPTAKKRMLLDFSFCFFSFFKILQLLFRKKYDYVITVVPCFQIGLLAVLYKKIKGAKFLYHIQDLQIDAARDLKMIQSQTLLNALLSVEKYILKNADLVSSVSPGMIKRIRAKYKREIIFFPNWVDTKLFYPLEGRAMLKEEFNFCAGDKIILYSGAIGEKQGLESIIYAAELLKHRTSLKFVISGTGPYKERLEELKNNLKLENVVFLPLQPFENLNKLLNMADVHLVLQKAHASDLVMPSKLTNILSVGGIAIISACENTSLYDIVSLNKIGILIEPEDKQALTTAIEHALKDDNKKINQNARSYAEEFLSIEKIIPGYTFHMQ